MGNCISIRCADREVVFQCRDEGLLRAPVRWSRGNGLLLPPGSRDIGGRLEMPNIKVNLITFNYFCSSLQMLICLKLWCTYRLNTVARTCARQSVSHLQTLDPAYLSS